jgi:hypothetical protein
VKRDSVGGEILDTGPRTKERKRTEVSCAVVSRIGSTPWVLSMGTDIHNRDKVLKGGSSTEIQFVLHSGPGDGSQLKSPRV